MSRNLASVRAAHQTGADRVVFDFGTGPLPPYVVEQARSFIGISGQPVAVEGNTHFAVRFPQAGSMPSYTGPQSLRPGLPLVKEVKVVENFEGVLIFGIGLERLACPRILELGAPARLVLDFPTPP